MSQVPRPTTYKQSEDDGAINAHAESHEPGGTDPVLGQVIYHGSVFANQGSLNSDSDYAATNWNLDFWGKGGNILVFITGYRALDDTTLAFAAVKDMKVFFRLRLDGTNVDLGTNESIAVQGETSDMFLAFSTSGTLSFFIPGGSDTRGDHNLTLYYQVGTDQELTIQGYMHVFELVPTSRS